ncbi:MAG: GTP-binding protein [Desulfobacterales bacterium]
MSAPFGNQPAYKADILLLAGFLGAGKTTLLKRILSWETDLSDTVVLVNEFGDIGIDGALLQDSGSNVIELTSGCICCTLSADLHQSLTRIWNRFKPRRILVEASGVADPKSIITVLQDPQIGQHMQLKKIITVLEADIWGAREVFGQLFYNQLEMAHLILLNKIDLTPAEKIPQFLNEIHDVIPGCQLVPTVHCEIDPETLWTPAQPKMSGLKSIEFFQPSALNGKSDSHHSHPAKSLDFVMFSFRDSGIIDEAGFKEFIRNLPWELFRIKGTVRFADRLEMLNFVGGKSEWLPWEGEPETRLAFIGWKINKEETLEDLKRCLIKTS